MQVVRKERDGLVEEQLVPAQEHRAVDLAEQQRGQEWENYVCEVYRARILPGLVDDTCNVLESIQNDLRREIAEVRGAVKQVSRTAVPGPQGLRGPPGHLPSVMPWRRGSVMYSGMVCHHKGSSFQARVDTAQEPTLKAQDWQPIAIAGGLQERIELERALIERQRADISRLEARIEALERKACKCGGAS
jgi:hypothetical protein